MLLANKLIEKISDPCNAEEHIAQAMLEKSFIRKENRKSVKQSYQPNIFENPNIFNIKSIITQHPKTSDKLFKTITQAEKVGSNSSLYNDTKKSKNFLNEKNVKSNKTRK